MSGTHGGWGVGGGGGGVGVFFFKQKTAYEIGTGDWSSDVCSSDLLNGVQFHGKQRYRVMAHRVVSRTLKTLAVMHQYLILHFWLTNSD